MTPARRAPAARARRTHAERTAETRTRILHAVVESIAEVGFQRTTAAEITRRSGVTWGAVQHHFGDKDGILEAVLEDSFERFAARLSDIATFETSLDERVSLFIDRAWEHFGSDHYRSTFQILLAWVGAEGQGAEPLWQSRMFESWLGIWRRLFPGSGRGRRERLLQHYTIAVLSGLASTRMLGAPPPDVLRAELDLLKSTLVRELAR